jgi:probable F420-dependent oxidoreductase
VHIGISRPPTPPHPIADVDGALVARIAEELGFEFFQDTLVMLARASGMTTRITLGSGVFLIPEHHPVLFAKQLASLDFYSGGRLVVGAGVGWSRVECELLGGNFDRRWAQAREAIQVMKRLWTEETVTYEGEFFTVPPVQLYPQPATRGGPPVLIGGRDSDLTLARVVEFGDGWLPAFVTPETIADGAATIRGARQRLDRLAQEAGRDPASLQISAIIRGDQIDGDLAPRAVVGRDVVRRFEDAGVQRVAVSLSTLTSEQDARDALERIAVSVL